jgi:hypothetical protein
MKMNYRSAILTGGLLLIFGAMDGMAQCRNYTKNQCLPMLDGYVASDSYNSARFSPGESAELTMTFTEGVEYRLLVCAQSILGEVTFNVFDDENTLLYSNAEKGNNPLFDFKVAGTQQLTIQVQVPAQATPSNLVPQGCVSIALGYKKE